MSHQVAWSGIRVLLQGMRCPTRVWWAIMQVRLDSQLQTHEIVPILAHAQQHYWELNIFVACWTTRVKPRYEIHPTRVWCVIMQVRGVKYKHMITKPCMLQLGSRQGHRCPTRVWWAIMQVRRVNYKHMRSPILAHAPTRVSWVTKLCMLQLGSRQGMRCPTRVWWAIMQVRRVNYKHMRDHQYLHMLQLGSRQGMRCPTRV